MMLLHGPTHMAQCRVQVVLTGENNKTRWLGGIHKGHLETIDKQDI